MHRAPDVSVALRPLLPNQRRCIEVGRHWVSPRKTRNGVDRLESFAAPALRVEVRQIREWHERGYGLAGAFDDQPLPSGGFIKQLAEFPADLEGGNRSHSTMIAP